MSDRLKIGLTIHLTSYTGWGMIALGLAQELASRADVDLSLFSADLNGVNALERSRLEPILNQSKATLGLALIGATKPHFDGLLIHADGNQCNGPTDALTANRHVGLMVFEDTAILKDFDKLERLRRYDLLVTASRWNNELLLDAGLPNTLVHQGIDPTVWHPAPKSGRWKDRFVVFSGGKLEYRKGQDIVLAAFRDFQKQHPSALLLTCWQNPWTDLACDMTLNGWVATEPERLGNLLDIEGWGEDNGLPEGSHIDLGLMPNSLLAPIVREADVAVFASRAEGATNLGAMECLAAGIPTLVSANTGHRDLPRWEIHQSGAPRQPSRFFGGIEGWGESDPAHLVERLEWWLADKKPGQGQWRGALHDKTWHSYTDQLVTLIRRST